MAGLRAGLARDLRRPLRHLDGLDRLPAAHRAAAEPDRQVRLADPGVQWGGHRHLRPQRHQPHPRRLQGPIPRARQGAHRHRGRTLRGALGHRLQESGARHLQDWDPAAEERWRWEHHLSAAGQDALLPTELQLLHPYDEEARGVGHRRQAGALLHQERDPGDVPQSVRLPLQRCGHT